MSLEHDASVNKILYGYQEKDLSLSRFNQSIKKIGGFY